MQSNKEIIHLKQGELPAIWWKLRPIVQVLQHHRYSLRKQVIAKQGKSHRSISNGCCGLF